MEFTKEMIEKAKAAKSVEELAEIAKAEGIELTAEEAKMHFDELHKTGELSDEELDNVAGGGCFEPDYKYEVGDWVIVNRHIIDDGEHKCHRSYVIERRDYGRAGRFYWGKNTNEPFDHARFYEKWILGKGQVCYGPGGEPKE